MTAVFPGAHTENVGLGEPPNNNPFIPLPSVAESTLLNQPLSAEKPFPDTNLEVEYRDGLTILKTPFDPTKETLIVGIGAHQNEHPNCMNGDKFGTLDNDPSIIANPHLRVINELSLTGTLSYNIVMVADLFADLIPSGERLFKMPGFQVGECDPNRVADMMIEALIQSKGHNINPYPNPLGRVDPNTPMTRDELLQQEIYWKVQQRICTFVTYLLENYPDAPVMLAHADRVHEASLENENAVSHPHAESFPYIYYHLLGEASQELKAINFDYVASLEQIPGVQVAPEEYLMKQEQNLSRDAVEPGAIYFDNLKKHDGSIEVLLAMLGFSIALSHESPDNLDRNRIDLILKRFYSIVPEGLFKLLKAKERNVNLTNNLQAAGGKVLPGFTKVSPNEPMSNGIYAET